MSKFRIGQRVRCINQPIAHDERDRILFEGRTYTIKKIIDGHYVILGEIGRPHNFSEGRFELINDILPDELFTL